MKTNCEAFVEEIAAFASDAAELSTEEAAHARKCAECRGKIAELKAVAAIHREAAANLAEPKRRLSRAQLERALASGGLRRSDFAVRWWPVLAGALALALIVGAALIHRLSRDRMDARPQAKQEQRETKAGEEALEPTLLALRHDVEVGRDPVLVGTTGAGIRHYRVKDAESELRY